MGGSRFCRTKYLIPFPPFPLNTTFLITIIMKTKTTSSVTRVKSIRSSASVATSTSTSPINPIWYILILIYLFGCFLLFLSAIGIQPHTITLPQFKFSNIPSASFIMSVTAPFKTLSAKAAFQLDQELMSTGEFSIDQLMELAGLAVAKTIYKEYPPNEAATTTKNKFNPNKVLVLVGPGNNGGDGLVAARHLKLWNYDPIIYYPKRPASNQLYSRLIKQLQDLNVPELTTLTEVKHLLDLRDSKIKIIIDSIFGFSFKPPIREPFKDLINYLGQNHDHLPPIVSVDIPSGWDVDEGPGTEIDIQASCLISLTAPKPCAKLFVNSGPDKIHYLGGRFINPRIAKEYGIEDIVNKYQGDELIVKL